MHFDSRVVLDRSCAAKLQHIDEAEGFCADLGESVPTILPLDRLTKPRYSYLVDLDCFLFVTTWFGRRWLHIAPGVTILSRLFFVAQNIGSYSNWSLSVEFELETGWLIDYVTRRILGAVILQTSALRRGPGETHAVVANTR